MLNVKVLKNKDRKINLREVNISDFYITTNQKMIGGYIDADYNFAQNDNIILWDRKDNDNSIDNQISSTTKIQAKNVVIQGKVTFNTILKVHKLSFYKLADNPLNYTEFKFVFYNGYIITQDLPKDWNIVQQQKQKNTLILSEDSVITEIKKQLNDENFQEDYLIVNNDYVYIEDGKFGYKNKIYQNNVDFLLNDKLPSQYIIHDDGTVLNIKCYKAEDFQKKQKIKISLFRDDDIIHLSSVLRMNENFDADINGSYLYAQIDNFNHIGDNSLIVYQTIKKEDIECIIHEDNIRYIIHNNQRYYEELNVYYEIVINTEKKRIFISNKKRTINGVECYEAFYDTNGIIFVQKNNKSKGFISITDDGIITLYEEIEVFNIPSIVIEENIYPIYDFNVNDKLIINEHKYGELKISKNNNNSSIIFSLKNENLISDEIKKCTESFFNDINQHKYIFYYTQYSKLKFQTNNHIFITSPHTYSVYEDDASLSIEYKNESINMYDDTAISFFKQINSYVLTVPLSIDMSRNQNQELLQGSFFENEKQESINPIIDMEKNVYFPCFYKSDNSCEISYPQDLTQVNDIVFNLHFRTRDLGTWDIEVNGNWFVKDKYDGKIGRSDLLSFLKFTDKDVFYQKSKLKKSFLRLSFYDSPNPSVQNLLYYSTIFIDERHLYNKYIKNINTIESQTFTNVFTNTQVKNISVNTEYGSNINATPNEEKRLSCQLVVNNMYKTTNSSDGYYLYLFRDFMLPFEPRSIYMKAEFNHAGLGKTLQFMLPRRFKVNNNILKSLTLTNAIVNENTKYEVSQTMPNTVLDNDNVEYKIQSELLTNISDFQEGFDIKDIYYQQYIEFKLIYDEVNQRYCYYLPFDSQNNNNLILNLFELKIK